MSYSIISYIQIFQSGHVQSSCHSFTQRLEFSATHGENPKALSNISHIGCGIQLNVSNINAVQDPKPIKVIRGEMLYHIIS